jgi:hypothetical protein
VNQPLVVRANRWKAALGAVASVAMAVLAVLAGASDPSDLVLLAAIVWACVFAVGAVKLARTALRREPLLVADAAGIQAPAIGVSVPWSEVVAVDHETGTAVTSTTHTLRISVRDGEAVLRRRVGDAPLARLDRAVLVTYDRLDIALDDVSMPAAEVVAAIEKRAGSAIGRASGAGASR